MRQRRYFFFLGYLFELSDNCQISVMRVLKTAARLILQVFVPRNATRD